MKILRQIINKLNLTQKDKNDLVDIINSSKGGNSEIPDWNANKGEESYIKNRTHYCNLIRTKEQSDALADQLFFRNIEEGNLTFNDNIITWHSGADIVERLRRNIFVYLNDYVEDEPWLNYKLFFDFKFTDADGYNVLIYNYYDSNSGEDYIKFEFTHAKIDPDTYNDINNIDEFKRELIYVFSDVIFTEVDIDAMYAFKQLNVAYIPDTIARVNDYELPHIKLDISETDSNVTTLNNKSVSLTDRCVCDLYENYYSESNALIHNGELYNGVITGIKEGKLVQYDVSFETGEIKQTLEINLDLLAPVVKLKIGDADDICQRNLELINFAINQNNIKEPNGEYNSHFDVDINHGLGAAQFTQGLSPGSVAGYATIITAQGYINKYDIYSNGKIVKITDDIDIVDIYNKVKNI